ncbi:MAG: hypothetical protein DRQ56_06310, partial [Gammaproteobacteria bacterium]
MRGGRFGKHTSPVQEADEILDRQGGSSCGFEDPVWFNSPRDRSIPQSVTQLDGELVGVELPLILGNTFYVVVVDHVKIRQGGYRPAQAGVAADRIAFVVVLDEAAQLQVGREVQLKPGAEQVLVEGAFGQIDDV